MNIPQIKLLRGSHEDVGRTGLGCFMNVIAYLNGEPTITDQSDCVCYVMRPLAIWANDWMTDAERPVLLPFILRAIDSRTDERAEISRRLALVIEFAKKQSRFAAESAKYAAEYAAESAKYAAESAKYAAEYAKYAAEYAAKYAAKYAAESAESAKYAAKYAEYAAEYTEYAAEYTEYRKENIATIIELFNAAFPPLSVVDNIIERRIRTLESLAV